MAALNSDDLTCFLAVVKANSLSRAALELGTDQSTVSRQIARIEQVLGTRVFHRSGRGVSLTEAGEVLVDYAQQVESTLQAAVTAVNDRLHKGPAKLIIAAQPTIAHTAFGAIALALKARFPATKLRFIEGLAGPILHSLAVGEIDLAILYTPEHTSAQSFDYLFEEDLMLIAPAAWEFEGDEYPVSRLGELPMIFPSTEHGLRVLGENLAAKHGVQLQIAMESDASNVVSLSLVEDGCGFTLLPYATALSRIQNGSLRALRLIDPKVVRTVSMAMAKNRPAMAQMWEINQLVKQAIFTLIESGAWPGARL